MPGTSWPTWYRRKAWSVGMGLLVWTLSGERWPARGDEFSRISGAALFEAPRRFEGVGTRNLSVRAMESLPEVVRGERSALVLVETDEGNLAKLLVSPGLRRRAGKGERKGLEPVLSLDRFETIDRGDRSTRRARGREIVLFDGLEFDLDSGQVVPAGFGGDIVYRSGGEGGPVLASVGPGRLYPIDRPFPASGPTPGLPSPGPEVLPADFNGRYTLISNGQTTGALELAVREDGTVSGHFRSDRNGSIYPVSGRVAADLTRRIAFEIRFPRSRQSFEGLLWTEEKNAFAGTVQILEHPYSFIAVREGANLIPESIDATSPARAPSLLKGTTRVIVVEAESDRYRLDGVAKSAGELKAALAGTVRGAGTIEVLLRVPPSAPFERMQRAVRLVRESGIETIRLASANEPTLAPPGRAD